jgi:hypothetical protein
MGYKGKVKFMPVNIGYLPSGITGKKWDISKKYTRKRKIINLLQV